MNDRLSDWKNKLLINKFLCVLPENTWRIYEDCSIYAMKYREVYDKIIKIGVEVHSSIAVECDDSHLKDWMLNVLDVKSDFGRKGTMWLIPFLEAVNSLQADIIKDVCLHFALTTLIPCSQKINIMCSILSPTRKLYHVYLI